MFDHVKFGVSDYAASKAFFLKALEPLGVAVVSEGPPTYGVELSPKGKASGDQCCRRFRQAGCAGLSIRYPRRRYRFSPAWPFHACAEMRATSSSWRNVGDSGHTLGCRHAWRSVHRREPNVLRPMGARLRSALRSPRTRRFVGIQRRSRKFRSLRNDYSPPALLPA